MWIARVKNLLVGTSEDSSEWFGAVAWVAIFHDPH